MNANAEQREPAADAAGPNPETPPTRRRRAAKAAAAPEPAAEAPAKRPRRARKPSAKPAAVAADAPVEKAAKPRARRRPAAKAPTQLPLEPVAVEAAVEAPAAEAAEAVVTVGKARTVRESVKLTEGDLAALDNLSARAAALGRKAGKSTLARAAVRALAALDDAGLAAALDAPVPPTVAATGGRRRKSH